MSRISLAFWVFCLIGCGGGTSSPGNAPGVPVALTDAPREIKTVAIQKRAISWSVQQPGTIQPFESAPLMAKLPGFIRKIHADIGDPVRGPEFDKTGKMTNPGQLLVELDIPELEQESLQKLAFVEQANAEVELAQRQAQVAQEHAAALEAQVMEARAGLTRIDADIDRWTSELKRIEELVARNVVEKQTLDETRKQYQSAKAAKLENEAKVLSAQAVSREGKALQLRAEADVKASQAKAKVAAADAQRVKALVQYAQIRAPFTGVVTARSVHTGHFLQPNPSGRAEPLLTVVRLDTVRVFVDVPESAVEMANPGTPAVVRVPALSQREYTATITRTAKVVNPDSRTLRVEIDLPNPDGALRAGFYCVVKIAATTPDAWVLPASAILFADETAYVYLIENGKAQKMRVQLGQADGAGYQVLGQRRAATTAGDWLPLTGTEIFASGNLGALADGQAVRETK